MRFKTKIAVVVFSTLIAFYAIVGSFMSEKNFEKSVSPVQDVLLDGLLVSLGIVFVLSLRDWPSRSLGPTRPHPLVGRAVLPGWPGPGNPAPARHPAPLGRGPEAVMASLVWASRAAAGARPSEAEPSLQEARHPLPPARTRLRQTRA